jgi:cytochrome c biogenesis protein CcmG/thiol:disulfide interchange protein DsbE
VSETKSGNKSLIWVILGVVAVGGTFWLAFAGSGDALKSYENPAFSDVVVQGDAVGLFPGQGGFDPNDPAIGLPAPVVTGEDYNGNVVTISNDGEPKILVFVAHWCPHCQAEVPRLSARFGGGSVEGGVQFYTVATSTNATRGNFPPAPWLESSGLAFPTVMDDVAQTVAQSYGLNAFPYWVAIGPDGNIVGRGSGQFDADQITAFIALAGSA